MTALGTEAFGKRRRNHQEPFSPVISPILSLNNNHCTANRSFTPGSLQVSSGASCEAELFAVPSLGLKGFAKRYRQIC